MKLWFIVWYLMALSVNSLDDDNISEIEKIVEADLAEDDHIWEEDAGAVDISDIDSHGIDNHEHPFEIDRGHLYENSTLIYTNTFGDEISYVGTEVITAFLIESMEDVPAEHLELEGGLGYTYLKAVLKPKHRPETIVGNEFKVTIWAEL